MSICNIKRQKTNKYLFMERELPIIVNQNQILLHSTDRKEKASDIESHCGDVCMIFSFLTATGVKQNWRRYLHRRGKKKKKIRKWKETLTKCKVSTCQLYSCCSWNCPHCINSYVKILNMCSINKKQKSKIHATEEIPVSLLTSINCFSINKVVKPSIYKTRFKCETCALLPDYLACHE